MTSQFGFYPNNAKYPFPADDTLRYDCHSVRIVSSCFVSNIQDGPFIHSMFRFILLNIEGPEGIKWELGVAYFLAGKMGFHALGLGFISNKTIENGNGITI